MVNRIVLVGHLGADPEIRVTGGGLSIANMRIAVKRIRAREGQQDTDWIRIKAFGKTAEFCGNYLKKGYLIAVDGRLEMNEWETQSGEKRTTPEVISDSIQNLTPRDRSGGGGGGAPQSRPSQPSGGGDADLSSDIDATFGDSGDDFDPFGDA